MIFNLSGFKRLSISRRIRKGVWLSYCIIKTVYEGGFYDMKATAEKINPEDCILSVLSPEDRLEASFKISFCKSHHFEPFQRRA